MAARRQRIRQRRHETAVINGVEHDISIDVLECHSVEKLTTLHGEITATLGALHLEQARLMSAVPQEQSRALQLHEEFRRLHEECGTAAARMPKDQWSLFTGSSTSEEIRQRTLGPYWKRMEEIEGEGKTLGVTYAYGRSPYDVVGGNGYLFFEQPGVDYKTKDGLGPPRDWTPYRATTKSQRRLETTKESIRKFARIEKRVAVAIRKRTREELLWAKRIERERVKEERERKARERHQELRAAAAANTEEMRRLADLLRSKLSRQTHCPYCGEQLGDAVHVDHIYPVSKGGRSVERNLVKTCIDCNQKKGNRTLTQFIRDCELDREHVETRLSELGKDF